MSRQCRTWYLIAYLFLLPPICLVGIAQEKTGTLVIPVEDKTGPGSPLHVSGEVAFRETIAANEVTSARSENIKARNISDKPILLLVASFECGGPKSSADDVDLVVDNFFRDKAVLPGEDLILLQRSLAERQTSEPFRMAPDQKKVAMADFYLRFVQFSDGSTFGDLRAGKKWLDGRASTLASLKRLQQIYHEQGEPAFSQALGQGLVNADRSSLWNHVREVKQTDGDQAAIGLIDRMLASALRHETKLGQE